MMSKNLLIDITSDFTMISPRAWSPPRARETDRTNPVHLPGKLSATFFAFGTGLEDAGRRRCVHMTHGPSVVDPQG